MSSYRCGCKMCSDNRMETIRRQEMGFDSFPDAAKKLIRKLDDMVAGSDEHLNYLNSIIDGSWPSADEIIAGRREKLKNGPTEEELKEREKYPRWEMQVICDGEIKWVGANLLDNGTFVPLNPDLRYSYQETRLNK